VENAVVHGLDAGSGRLRISIIARASTEGLELLVENDGVTVEPERTLHPDIVARSGVGLAGTRARLATAYGDGASLRLLPREGGGVSVRILVPQAIPAVGWARRGTAPRLVEAL
jgi:two-component system sensor histidine kinase YesM